MARKHSSEAFYALDDPLEAATFSVLVICPAVVHIIAQR